MKRHSCADGYTIVEVLIVLGVTGLIFLSAVLLVSGQQGKTQFTQAIQEVQTQLQQTVGEVVNGFYPSINFTCMSNAGSPASLTITNAASPQGGNGGCVFLGKALQFGVGVAGAGAVNQQYSIYPIAGLQCFSGATSASCAQPTQPISSDLSQAAPTALYTSANPSVSIDDSQLQTLQNGLKATKVYYNDNPANTVGTIGFLSSLASYSGCVNLCSGSQQVNLWAVSPTAPTDSRATAVGQIDTAASWLPATSLEICFKSGSTTNQFGKVTIGSTNGRQTSVNVQILNGTTCP